MDFGGSHIVTYTYLQNKQSVGFGSAAKNDSSVDEQHVSGCRMILVLIDIVTHLIYTHISSK